MVGVNFRHLEDVDIFNLLGLDPFEAKTRGLDPKSLRNAYLRVMLVAHQDRTGRKYEAQQLNVLKEFLCGFDWRDSRLPDRIHELIREGIHGWKSTWNPWLHPNHSGFHKPIPTYQRRSRGCGRVPHSLSASTPTQPGSSLANPIFIDASMIGAPTPPPNGKCRSRGRNRVPHPRSANPLSRPGSSRLNPIVIDAPGVAGPAPPAFSPSNSKGRCRAGIKLRRRRNRRFSEYHPSRESQWRPAPYPDQSDVESLSE
ncbi:MAG: hypothetical protein M1813_002610 [Trichoglossum hirsutum]|jgi:hypothetical protein|nr:MAG: hypothetical protein M1813_002610 [Trichoglossum hirsutum]